MDLGGMAGVATGDDEDNVAATLMCMRGEGVGSEVRVRWLRSCLT